MMQTHKEKIKAKISALLAKNVENGATEAEAEAAIEKAQQLMAKYMIEQGELEIRKTKCIKNEVPQYPSGYDLMGIIPSIAELFDCQVWCIAGGKKKIIVFFGFETDTELASYFYNYLCHTIITEAENFKATTKYTELRRHSHGRTITADFILGLKERLVERLEDMTTERHKAVQRGSGCDLVVVKSETVQKEYDALNMTMGIARDSRREPSSGAVFSGYARGGDVEIRRGIHGQRRDQESIEAS